MYALFSVLGLELEATMPNTSEYVANHKSSKESSHEE